MHLGLVLGAPPPPQGICFCYGLWGDDLAGHILNFHEWGDDLAGHILNFHEIFNIADSVAAEEKESVNGLLLHDTKFFMFTDNAVAEGAFVKETSTIKHLFELVLHLKRLEFDHPLNFYVIPFQKIHCMMYGKPCKRMNELFFLGTLAINGGLR
jgi:hypothetical protein